MGVAIISGLEGCLHIVSVMRLRAPIAVTMSSVRQRMMGSLTPQVISGFPPWL